jgi:hypothetical protein
MAPERDDVASPLPAATLFQRRVAARFAGSAQIWWGAAVVFFVITIAIASDIAVRSVAYDRQADGYDGDVEPRPDTHLMKGDVSNDDALHYRFRDSDGVEHRGTSYAAHPPRISDDAPFRVEYRSDDPSVSRIVGTRRHASSPWLLTLGLISLVVMIAACIDTARTRDGRSSLPAGVLLCLPIASGIGLILTIVMIATPR